MTGFDLARKVKAINPEVKLVLMTAFEVNKSEAEKVLPSLQVDAFIQKPISLEDIGDIVQKQLAFV